MTRGAYEWGRKWAHEITYDPLRGLPNAEAVYEDAKRKAEYWHPKSALARANVMRGYCGEVNHWLRAFGLPVLDFTPYDTKGYLR